MSKKSSLAASALALAVSTTFAQSSADSKYQLAYLDPVVVTASRFEQTLADVPAFAQVISKDEIVMSGATSVSEAVNKIGNINVRSLAAGPLGILADIDMRGFGASSRDNTLILVDGMRVSPIDSGSISWESISITNVERIEIIHGGGSVQYGDKAIGGVVNIITRGNLNQSPTVAATIGSYGTLLTNASITSGWGNTRGKLDVVADSTDGWRDNSQARQGMVRGLLSHDFGGSDRVFAEVGYSSQQYHFPGGVVGEVNAGDRKAAKFNNVGDKTTTSGSRGLLGLTKSFGNGWQFLAEAAYSESSATQSRPYYGNTGTGPGEIIYDKRSYDLTPRLKKTWNLSNDSVIGFDYQKAKAAYAADDGSQQNATITNKSVYATHRYFLTPGIEISGGARRQSQQANALDNSYSTVTTASKQQSANAADLAFTYRFGEGLKNKIFLRSNRAYRFANTDEYWGWKCVLNCSDLDWLNDVWVRSFEGILRPQKSDTVELGGALAFSRQSMVSATVYQIDTTDEIRYRLDDGTNRNMPKIRRQGTSLNLRYVPSSQWTLRSGLTWQHSEYREGLNLGKEVPLVPQVMVNLSALYEVNQSLGYRINVSYVGTQRYMDDDSNSKRLMPSYAVIDAGARFRERAWEFDVQVKNLADKKYANYGGYNDYLTVAPNTPPSSYYYYPGMPRTLWLSTRYRFN